MSVWRQCSPLFTENSVMEELERKIADLDIGDGVGSDPRGTLERVSAILLQPAERLRQQQGA